ncbi:MAG: ComF family protein [Sporolactobacillus sp.]
MLTNINPIKVIGNWDEGFVLDRHIDFSVFEGNDEYGHPIFDTTRTKLGECLYQFKYKGKYDKLNEIMVLVEPFLKTWTVVNSIDFVIPSPFSKDRKYHPTNEIARRISSLIKRPYAEVLQKTNNVEAKDMTDKSQIVGTIVMTQKPNGPHNILLVDDLYDTGTTLRECVRVLKLSGINKVFVLTMTKTNG